MGDIQGIDGSVLINALRAGQKDRLANDQEQLKVAQGQLAMQRQRAALGVMAQGGLSGQGGVMGNAMGGGGASPINPQTIGQVAQFDPEMGQKLASAAKSLSDTQIQEMQHRNTVMAGAAHYIMQAGRTPQERAAAFDHAVPLLVQNGFTQEQIQAARNDLSDAALKMYQNQAMSVDKVLSSELAERQFNAGKVVSVQEGGSAYRVLPNGQTSLIVGPNPGDKPTGAPMNSGPAPLSNEGGGALLFSAAKTGRISASDAARVKASLGPQGEGKYRQWLQQNNIRVVTRTGTAADGRRVVQYEDGTVDYAD